MTRPGRAGTTLLAIILTLALFGIIGGGCLVSQYNHVVRLNADVEALWAQVDVQLQRRYDLIPNLVATVEGYASHEKAIFEAVANARKAYFTADRGEKVEAAAGVERALSRLLSLQETYPELKAQANFTRLMDELAGTENRLAVERKRFNDGVRDLNTYVRSFFGRLVAGWAGVKERSFFEPPQEAKAAPKVDFKSGR